MHGETSATQRVSRVSGRGFDAIRSGEAALAVSGQEEQEEEVCAKSQSQPRWPRRIDQTYDAAI